MPRARNIKPGFFKNENLAELPVEARLLFIGLWTLADRRGRLEDRPKKIKMEIFPADNFDVDLLLQQLHDMKFIERYGASTVQVRCKHQKQYIQVLAFEKHQNPHKNERESDIPERDQSGASTVQEPEQHRTNPADSLIPDSLKPNSEPIGSDASASKSLAERIWGEGLDTLSRLSGKPVGKLRSTIGMWRKKHGDEATFGAIVEAERQAVSDPVAWVSAALAARAGPAVDDVPDYVRGAS